MNTARFYPCVIVPVYNPGPLLEDTLRELADRSIACILVDDGSNAATKRVLQDAATADSSMDLITLPENRGKGAAVMAGFSRAEQRGFTHVLQIDADGQHHIADLPRFLAAAEQHPNALIVGRPIFDQSAPAIRLWGRKLSNFFCRLETLSGAISDVLCGYRLYPLAATQRVCKTYRIGRRMDFDTDLAVRLVRTGTPVVELSTPIVYPTKGVSHYRMLADNALLVWLNVRLLASLPWYLMQTVLRSRASKPWFSVAERGSSFAFHLFCAVYRLLGYRACSVLLYPIVFYFYLTSTHGRRASLTYLRRLSAPPFGRPLFPTPPGQRMVFRHCLEFGRMVFDKIRVWSGDVQAEHVQWEGLDPLLELVNQRRGAILLSAHFGNLDVSRALAARFAGVRVHALMFQQHARLFESMLGCLDEADAASVVSTEAFGIDSLVKLRDLIDSGGLVAALADRPTPGSPAKTSSIPFLGAPALFPQGPWILASVMACPVYLIFCVRLGPYSYRVSVEPFADRIMLPRANREDALRGYMERFALALERACAAAPLQWFNLYDFWYKDASVQQRIPSERDLHRDNNRYIQDLD